MTASSFAAMLSRRALQLAGFLLLALPVALGQPPPPPGFGFGSGFTSSFTNPILPGFHPDPSCVFISEWADGPTFFCATSSFNAFPGIPIHASRDLRNWKLVGHVLNRPEQLPRLAETNRSTRYVRVTSERAKRRLAGELLAYDSKTMGVCLGGAGP